jgi:hypothetical protein
MQAKLVSKFDKKKGNKNIKITTFFQGRSTFGRNSLHKLHPVRPAQATSQYSSSTKFSDLT